MIINAKPAKYPDTNTAEHISVYKFLDIVDKTSIKPDPKLMDKYPNTDGYIEIVDKNQIPIGKCEIQIKTLADKFIDTPKHQCDLPFLAYCERSILPVLLIIVNAKYEKAFWIHVSLSVLKELASKIKKDSINLPIPTKNEITRTNKVYIDEWIKIIKETQQKLINYDLIADELNNLEKTKKQVESFLPLPQSISATEVNRIQIFIDIINNSLDSDFIILKQTFYKNVWKLGMIYSVYDENNVTFALVPINYGTNQPLIRELSKNDFLALKESAVNILSSSNNNPINENPNSFGYTLIKQKLDKLFKSRLAKIITIELANEYVVDFIDNHLDLLGYQQIDNYDVDGFDDKLINHLPLFYESLPDSKKSTVVDATRIIEFELLEKLTTPDERKQISKNVSQKIASGITPSITWHISSKNIDFKYLNSCIKYMRRNGEQVFSRLYSPPQTLQNTNYVWGIYSPQQAFEKIQTIYNSLPQLIELFIDTYFSNFKDKVKFFSGIDRLIVNLNYTNSYNSIADSPSVDNYFLKSTNANHMPSIDYYLNEEGSPLTHDMDSFDSEIEIDKVKYTVISVESGKIEYFFEKNCLQSYLFATLEERFDQYLSLKI